MSSPWPAIAADALPIGPHRVVRGRDIYAIEIVGDLSAEHMPIFLDLAAQYGRECGYVLVLVNCLRAGTMHPEARRLAIAFRKHSTARSATAISGAGLATRTVATLLFNAMALVTGKESAVSFFKHESEARLWLDERRPQLVAWAASRKR